MSNEFDYFDNSQNKNNGVQNNIAPNNASENGYYTSQQGNPYQESAQNRDANVGNTYGNMHMDTPSGDTFNSPYDYRSNMGHNMQGETPYAPVSGNQYGYDSSGGLNSQAVYTPGDFNKPKKKKKGGKKAIGIVAIACALLVAFGGVFYIGAIYGKDDVVKANAGSTGMVANADTVAVSNDSGEISTTITEVVENAMPSMVSINTIMQTSMSDTYGYFFGYIFGEDYDQTYETNASGSGIIIGQNDEELLIVTNNHVVEDSTEIAVEFIDGVSYSATIKGTSSDNDLAVISVPLADISSDTLSQIKVAVLGDSTKLKLGESAIAIGNALGYGQSVTVGYISATEREVQLTDKTMTLIQTDAAINPGNSGGALLNIKGEVIGINSAKYSDTSVEGTGYAIPISDAIPIINALMNSTYTPEEEKPYLGIYGQEVPVAYQERFGWPTGVYVSQVTSGSPAELAGLQQGDIITAIDGVEVTTMEELQAALEECEVGDTVELSVTRSQNEKLQEGTLKATLIARGDIEE